MARAGELANLGEAGVLPAELDPGDVAPDHEAKDDGAEDIGDGKDQGGDAGAAAEHDRDHHDGEGDEAKELLRKEP